ncbi:ABC transporter substrate-binding protein [Pseudorhodoplanes sp.]|uniref:ABC transporter substrate-binding protein n=1 Tax=Pseudorhodoplanes sp. TaxID=1934341 RepID=UPI003D0E837C
MNLRKLACIVGFGVAICAPSASAAAEKLALGYVSADAVYGPWFYAQEKGIFAKHGLETTLAFLDSGTKGMQALLGESIEICACDGPTTTSAFLAGADVRFIGATLTNLSGNVYAAKDIKSPADLKGKKWAISSFGSESHSAALASIKFFGLSPSDVTLVQLGNQGNRFAGLESGQVQVTTLLPPVHSRAEQAGYPKLGELPKIAPDFLSVAPVTSTKMIKNRRAVVKAFLTALAEATEAYKKDRDGAEAVLQKQLKIADIKNAKLAWEYYSPLNSSDLRPTERSIQYFLDQSKEEKAKSIKPKDLMDLSILDELTKEGKIKSK